MNGPYITFFGRFVRDPELRHTQNENTPYLNMTVAVNTVGRNGEEEETLFIDVTLWRQHAVTAADKCQKGQMVYISGRYSQRTYTHRDGSPGISPQVNARDFMCVQMNLPAVEQDQASEPTPEARTAGARATSVSGPIRRPPMTASEVLSEQAPQNPREEVSPEP